MSLEPKKHYPPSTELWLILLGGGILFSLVTLGLQRDLGAFRILQGILGIIYALCVPGYLIQLSLFPKREDLNWDGRLALSFGLSIAIMAPLALILNQFERGLSLIPLTSTWLGLIVVFVIIAALRQRKCPPADRARLRFKLQIRETWMLEPPSQRRLLIALSVTLLIALSAGIGLAILPPPGSEFTEFYILGEEGMAEKYPYTVIIDQPVQITMGINNLEGETMTYTLEAHDASGVIGELGPLTLQDDESSEFDFYFIPRTLGEDVEINFFLFQSGIAEPYRETRLITDVVTAGGTP